MKSLDKGHILESGQYEATKLEKEIMEQAEHPFLVGLNFIFQTDNKVCFVMRFVQGGELFAHLHRV
jgi:serine/threonine protein kinase